MLETPKRELEVVDGFRVSGRVRALLLGPDGETKQDQTVENIITQVGRQYLTRRAANIATLPNQVTGMRLGTSTATPTETGAGAVINAYVSASQKAIDGSHPTEQLQGVGSRLTWQTTWIAGEATNTNINEVAITNENPLSNVAGVAANTLARAIIALVNKGAGDTLVVTWTWDIGA